MKFSYQCPKCTSSEVIKVEGWALNQNTIASVSKWGTKKGVIDRFFCLNCGYTEEYVQLNAKFLKWGREILGKQDSGDDYV